MKNGVKNDSLSFSFQNDNNATAEMVKEYQENLLANRNSFKRKQNQKYCIAATILGAFAGILIMIIVLT